MCGFHKQHAWVVRKDLHGKAGLMKAAAAGGLRPQQDSELQINDTTVSAQGAWQEGLRLRGQCHTEYGNAPATRRAEFSVQRKNGAEGGRCGKFRCRIHSVVLAPARVAHWYLGTANALTNTESTTYTGKIEEGQLQPNAKPSGDGAKII